MKTFWIVVHGDRGPVTWPYPHVTEKSAITEAERLCREHGGSSFVCCVTHLVKKMDVTVEALEQEPPF